LQVQEIQQTNLRTFIILWATQILSVIGSEMTYFAITIWAWKVTGQATSLSLLLFFNQIPKLVTALFVGIFVDKWNRKRLMIIGDTATGISTIAILLLFLTNQLEIWHIYVAAVVIGPFRHFQYFAFSTSISTLVPKQHLTRAVVMTEHIGEFTSNIIAPGLAGAIYSLIGLPGILTIDIITFLIAVSATWLVHIPQPLVSEVNQTKGKIWQDLTFGYRYIIKNSGLSVLLLFLVIFHFIDAVTMGIHSPLILARSANDSAVFAGVQSAIGLGGLVGALLLSIWGGFKRRIHGLLLGTIFYYGIMMVFSLVNLPSIWMITGFMAAVFWPWITSSNQVIWLSKVPPDVQGRVFSTRYLLTLIASPIGLAIAGPLADNFFQPAMMSEGILTPIFGSLFGTSSGAGLAVQYTLFSLLGAVLGLGGYTWRRLRNVETIVPDYEDKYIKS
jgi:MFS family permease